VFGLGNFGSLRHPTFSQRDRRTGM
jgi:hypothetical protein